MTETREGPLDIAARKGVFVTSLRYRDSNTLLRVNNLVKAGLMRREGRIENGRAAYVLTDKGRAALPTPPQGGEAPTPTPELSHD